MLWDTDFQHWQTDKKKCFFASIRCADSFLINFVVFFFNIFHPNNEQTQSHDDDDYYLNYLEIADDEMHAFWFQQKIFFVFLLCKSNFAFLFVQTWYFVIIFHFGSERERRKKKKWNLTTGLYKKKIFLDVFYNAAQIAFQRCNFCGAWMSFRMFRNAFFFT